MQPILWFPFSCALILALTGCANNNSNPDPLGTGPFDSAGNYHEEWANDPSKWSKPGKRSKQPPPADDVPLIAKNEQPPPNANPLASPSNSYTRTTPRQLPAAPHTTSRHTPEPDTHTTASHTPEHKTHVTKTTKKSSRHVASTSSKPKAKSGRYSVKKGDSLSAIARRTGSSVSAIQKANKISGTLIHPGDALVIPKR